MSRMSESAPEMPDINQNERAVGEARNDPDKHFEIEPEPEDNAEPQQEVTGQLDRKPRNRRTPDGLDWETVAASDDRDAFQEFVRSYLEGLRADARHDIAYCRRNGLLREADLNAEELIGETLVQAWAQRQHKPERLSVRGWLVGIQHRVLQTLLEEQQKHDDRKAIELNTEVPFNKASFHVEEQMYEWLQPDDVTLWEELIPGSDPVDIELEDDRLSELDPQHRRVVVLHDEFELTLPEVAELVNANVREAAEMLEQARVNLRELLGNAPPEPTDEEE